jgi:hypothetical protein
MVCAECRTVAGRDARGWRGYLDDDGDLVLYCRRCAMRDFGPLETRPLMMDAWEREEPPIRPGWPWSELDRDDEM